MIKRKSVLGLACENKNGLDSTTWPDLGIVDPEAITGYNTAGPCV
jgi:hypothetical protein